MAVEIRVQIPVRIAPPVLTVSTAEDLERAMHQCIKIGESARRAMARAGVCDANVSIEQALMEEQVGMLVAIQQQANTWLHQLKALEGDAVHLWGTRIENGATALSIATSVIDIVASGAHLVTLLSGIGSGVQGVSSLTNKYTGWKKHEREIERDLLSNIQKRSFRVIEDLQTAAREYRAVVVSKETGVLSKKALVARHLFSVMVEKKRRLLGEVGREDELVTPLVARRLSIPELPHIGPRVEDWREAMEQAIGAGNALRRVALRDLRDEKKIEEAAIDLYKQIRILDYIIQEAEKAYQEPRAICGITREKCLIKSLVICENVAWGVNWATFIAMFTGGYSTGPLILKLIATVGQGTTSYVSDTILRSMIEQTRSMAALHHLLEEAKREREGFYLTLLSYYPYFDQDETGALTLKERAKGLENKMKQIMGGTSGEVLKDVDQIALRLLYSERERGVDIQQLKFCATSVPGVLLNYMQAYMYRHPHETLHELLMMRSMVRSGSTPEGEESPPSLGVGVGVGAGVGVGGW